MDTFPSEPVKASAWKEADFDALLQWSHALGASDIMLMPETYVYHRIHGAWSPATERPVTHTDICEYLPGVTKQPAAISMLSRGHDLDVSYDIIIDRGMRVRFRVNATACRTGRGLGVSIIFRSIPTCPPSVEDLGLEPSLMEGVVHPAGLVLVAGTMGSGKTTLLSSVIRHIRQNQPHRFIVTYEFPIEFNLTDIPGAIGPIAQTEIPTHLHSFDHAPVNATRRAIDVMLIGESRDLPTFRGVCEAAEIGTAAYTTVHTQSVAETVRRIVNKFPQNERPYMLTSLIGNLRMIVYQTLVPKIGGGRVAVREWLTISKDFRRELMGAEMADLDGLFHREIYVTGQPLIPYAQALHDRGVIDSDVLRAVEKRHAFGSIESSEVSGVA